MQSPYSVAMDLAENRCYDQFPGCLLSCTLMLYHTLLIACVLLQTRHSNRRKRRIKGGAQLHFESEGRRLEILPGDDGSNQEDILTRTQAVQTEFSTKLTREGWGLDCVKAIW